MLAPDIPPPPLLLYWREILALLAANGVVWWFIVRAVSESMFVTLLDRCKDRVMNRIGLWYADRVAKIDGAMQVVDLHRNRIDAFEARMDDQHLQKSKILETIGNTLISVQGEMHTMGSAILEMQTYLKTRDGDGPYGTRAGDQPAPRVRKPQRSGP